jgi:hypothetical protein
MEAIRAVTSIPDETAYAYSLVDAALRTHKAVASEGETRLTYTSRFKAKKILTGEERVAERLVYTRCFDTIASDRGGNVVDGLLSALKDKRHEITSQQLQRRKHLHSSRPKASTRQTGQAERQAGQAGQTRGQA